MALQLTQMAHMEQEMAGMREQLKMAQDMYESVNDLFEAGKLKQDDQGEALVVDDPEERESIASASKAKGKVSLEERPVQQFLHAQHARRQAQNFSQVSELDEEADKDMA